MIFFANQCEIRRAEPDDQDLQGECLTLITNAVIAWNTVYVAHAIDHLRQNGTAPTIATSRASRPPGTATSTSTEPDRYIPSIRWPDPDPDCVLR